MPASPSLAPVSSEPSPEPPSEPSVRVLRQFRMLFNAVKDHFRQIERDAGIGGAQLWALSKISATPGIGVNDLAAALDIQQSTASNLVKSLIERQLIATERREDDRRAVALFPLPAGQSVLASAPAPFSGVLPAALDSLDDATLGRLEHDLGSLIALLRADERNAKTPLADL